MKLRLSPQTMLVIDAFLEQAEEWKYGYDLSRVTGLKSGTLYPILMRMAELVPSTKRILMTGYTNPEFIARSMAIAGLSSCLVKPLKASQVADAIKAALSG